MIKFLGSFERMEQCPGSKLPEYAMIGRSNVGKSSLINMLVDKGIVARISKKPGKTRTINLFKVEQKWILADLPGYGFAHVSKTQRKKWDQELWRYLDLRPNLACAMVLVDASIPPQKSDLDFMDQLGMHKIPWVLVYTKIDKVKSSNRVANISAIRNAVLKNWSGMPPEFTTSALSGIGRDELMDFIEETNLSIAED